MVSEPLTRYCNVVTIGQLFIKMLMGLLNHVTDVNEMVVFSRKQELPVNPILVIELFDVWGIDLWAIS